jgi:hypothetical protein
MSVTDEAKCAKELAFMSMTIALACETLFVALLGTLRDQQKITPLDIKVIFFGAAANIDAMPSESDFQIDAVRRMRALIERTAAGFDVDLPPPGETGMQRKQ